MVNFVGGESISRAHDNVKTFAVVAGGVGGESVSGGNIFAGVVKEFKAPVVVAGEVGGENVVGGVIEGKASLCVVVCGVGGKSNAGA
jgi:hypothetical protein